MNRDDLGRDDRLGIVARPSGARELDVTTLTAEKRSPPRFEFVRPIDSEGDLFEGRWSR